MGWHGAQVRTTCGVLFLVLLGGVLWPLMQPTGRVHAAPALVQSTSNNTGNSSKGGTSVSASLGANVTANDLVVVICAVTGSDTIVGPSGFSTAVNYTSVGTGTTSQAIFYKVAAGTEGSSFGCSWTGTWGAVVVVMEFSGTDTSSPFDVGTSNSGSNTTVSSGSITTTNANDVLIGGLSTTNTTSNSSYGSWASSFTQAQNNTDSYKAGSGHNATTYYLTTGGGYANVSATGTYSTSVTASVSGNFAGEIAAFKATPTGALSVGIVTSPGGSIVLNPSFSLASSTYNFACHAVTGKLGTSSQQIEVTNTTGTPSWSLTIAASSTSDLWTGSVNASNQYDFNDAGVSGLGCTDNDGDGFGGQLTINPADTTSPAATITPSSGCSNTGISSGSSAAFSSTVSSITLATASSSASTGCYWDITGIGLSQTIPANQSPDNYSINLVITVM